MKTKLSFKLFFLVIFLVITNNALAEEHVIERGETSLQIAIDHNLTMEQLSQLNPGVDLEMMLVGDILIIPDKGTSFDEFLHQHYGEIVRITDINCELTTDQNALCLFHVENLSDLPLYDIRIKADIRGKNGKTGQAEAVIPLMQVIPGEKLPMSMTIPGPFDALESTEITVQNLSRSEMIQSTFRISPDDYTQTDSYLPDKASANTTILFTKPDDPGWQNRHINILAAAYDSSGTLIGVRSLYSDFYPQLNIITYTNNRKIDRIDLKLEMY